MFTNLDIQIHEPLIKPPEPTAENSLERKSGKTPKNVKLRRDNSQETISEVATIMDFSGFQSAKNQFNPDSLDRHLPIQYVDPVTGQKKCEYRCYNIFTKQLDTMVETD